MKAQGICRLGRDAEVRFTPAGDPVTNLSLAFDFGKRGNDGNRQTQWIDASLWGKRAEALAPYLLKGTQIVAYLEDVRIEEYSTRDGEKRSKMTARITDVELVAGQKKAPEDALPPAREAPARAPVRSGTEFDKLDDDIPF